MSRTRLVWERNWPLGLLCLLTASRWLFENMDPATDSTFKSEAAGLLLAALIPGLGLVRSTRGFDGVTSAWAVSWPRTVGTVLILAGPTLASALAGRTLRANDATLALVLSPVVVALASRTRSEFAEIDLTRLLWPSLAGTAALLLLIPQPNFQETRAWLGLAAVTVLAGLGAVLAEDRSATERPQSRSSFDAAVLLGMLLASVVFAGFSWTRSHAGAAPAFSWSGTALDGTQALLTVLALRRLGAYRWTTQFLLVPLIAVLEGVVFLHPTPDARSSFAFLLLAVSSVYQLFFAEPKKAPPDIPEATGVSQG